MKLKRVSMLLMACLLVMQPVSATAASEETDGQSAGSYSEKSEVVYATLNATGEQEDMYVVNNFTVDESGEMVDFGPYTSVENLTNLTDIEQNDSKVTFEADGDQFYYQGNLEGKPLPWDIDVSYQLNGNKIAPDELLGQDGALEIHIDTQANEEADASFFENYMLQISLPLNTDVFQNIETENGMIANSGKNRQVTFTVMPEKEESFVVKADVNDLEMESMEITATPSSMSVDEPDSEDMTNDMKSLSDATEDINDGVQELNNGIADLNSGARSLQDGSASYKSGINDLSNRSSDVIEGSEAIDKALENMSQSVGSGSSGMDLSQFEELQSGLNEIADGLKETESGLSELKSNYTEAYNALDESIGAIPDHDISEEVKALENSDENSKVIKKLIETYKATEKMKKTFANVKGAFESVGPTLEGVIVSLGEMRTNIETMAEELGKSLDNMNTDDSMKKLQEGLSDLSSQYDAFHNGLLDYTDGVSELSSSYNSLHSGVTDLKNGTGDLENGADELHNGTEDLAESTNDLPDQMQTEIDQMMNEYDKSDFEPVSFVSSKNEKVDSVQFVIKTESIKKDDDDETEDEQQQQEAEKGLWDRFLDLFK